jgi:hypothetical protein
MRQLLFGLGAALYLSISAVFAQDADIEGVISRQIEAFRQDDFATAFTFASPNIQRLFRNSENFGDMVRQGYPMVWRPARVDFLGLRNQNGRTVQRVLITDMSGVEHVLDYDMIASENGWVINGVAMLGQPDASV